ncbi:MAG: serine/threonine protein kinase, partial [Proteobacteria bacterium]|nr:serine/threonine protein kinase [Pseudomonadota bacterium]
TGNLCFESASVALRPRIVLEVLHQLVRRAGIKLREQRFEIPRSIRVFASPKLDGRAEQRALVRHQAYYLDYAERMGERARSGEPEANHQLATEAQNLALAYQANYKPNSDTLADLLALENAFRRPGPHSLIVDMLSEAIEDHPTNQPSLVGRAEHLIDDVANSADEKAIVAGRVLDGRYTVEAYVGRGGMAKVYRVRHNTLGTTHALKLLDVSTASIQRRLIQEGRAQGALRHPNIVTVTDVIDADGRPGLIMDYVDGHTLGELLERKKLSASETLAIATGMLRGVAAAHGFGLIHRDLKPGNILIETTAEGLVAKVTDFGLVKVLARDSDENAFTRTGALMGPPAYMAPEQLRNAKTVDERADVFSLGAILYELATGHRAFVGENMYEIFAKISAGDYVPPRTLVPQLSEAMNRAIVGALELERDQRIASCRDLLEIWSANEAIPPVEAPASSWA